MAKALCAATRGRPAVSPDACAAAQAVDDIRADLASRKRMLRLLQGDVGSGKTVVALLAMAEVVEAGRQAAMMAPTEILARQHYERLAPLAASVGLRIGLLHRPRQGVRARRALSLPWSRARSTSPSARMRSSKESIAFADLGLAVVDEQHRFGVAPTAGACAKGDAVDLLVMTATPIPRSLALAVFRRHGRFGAATKNRRGASRSTPASCRSIGSRRWWPGCPGDRFGRARLLGLSFGRGERGRLTSPRRKTAPKRSAQAFGDAVGLVHGRMPARRERRGDGALQARDNHHPGRDHGGRGRRRRARSDDHDRSSTPSASASRNCISCAGELVAGRAGPHACFYTRAR